MQFLQENLVYLVIPFVGAFVGWVTNVVALKMTFFPLEYIGFGPWVGWQGIIPSRASKMAATSVDLMLGKLITIEDQFAKIEASEVAKMSEAELQQLSRRIIDRVMGAQASTFWNRTPSSFKENIYKDVARELPQTVEDMMDDLQSNINEILDVKRAVINTLIENKALLNEIFLQCGEKEFRFIERSGAYFGFLFGSIQMVVWYFYDPWWLLPVAGLMVGYLTNWLALKLIFNPVKCYKIGPLHIQGIFIKRQEQVAEVYASIVSKRVLNSTNLFDNMIYGEKKEKLHELISKHIDRVIDRTAERYKRLMRFFQGEERLAVAKEIANFHFRDHFPILVHQVSDYTESALNLEATLRDRMAGLTPQEFQGFLRPVFQEDEFKLILVGALLGALAGFLQWLIFF